MFDEVREYEDEFYEALGKYFYGQRSIDLTESTIKPAAVGPNKYNTSITQQRSGQIAEDGYIEGIGRMQGKDWVADGHWERNEKYAYVRYVDPVKIYIGPTRRGEAYTKNAKTDGYLWVAGDIEYLGEFDDNMLNGQGTLTLADGTKKTGQWKDDVFEDGVNYFE